MLMVQNIRSQNNLRNKKKISTKTVLSAFKSWLSQSNYNVVTYSVPSVLRKCQNKTTQTVLYVGKILVILKLDLGLSIWDYSNKLGLKIKENLRKSIRI